MIYEYTKQNEGFEPKPYPCPAGKLTIGYGWMIENGIDEDLANIVFLYQMGKVEQFLYSFDFWWDLNETRQTVLADMCFQMGRAGFNRFRKMIAALNERDFEKAAAEILDSKYAKQTSGRAERNAEAMRVGSF